MAVTAAMGGRAPGGPHLPVQEDHSNLDTCVRCRPVDCCLCFRTTGEAGSLGHSPVAADRGPTAREASPTFHLYCQGKAATEIV